MRIHIFYASVLLMVSATISLIFIENSPRAIDICVLVLTIGGIFSIGSILGPQKLNAITLFIANLPLSKQGNFLFGVFTVTFLVTIAFLCDYFGQMFTNNDYIELSLRIGGVGLSLFFVLYIILVTSARLAKNKLFV
ncbi:hypothetical protein [Candidatus Uabimicrobium sp. HlEnr_7]|uniref:hypothetical protein n=1 Tax=Candidatus Uabimicrobium helgolandensis TaxID=3095367 RepID=UPI003557D063